MPDTRGKQKKKTQRRREHRGSRRLLETFQRRLMQEATQAAPKPLSMLTTVTLEAQELSMPSSAATPPRLAPYSTLVGTAITGTATRPPTPLGSAPSIPATQIITRASTSLLSRRSSKRL